MITVTNLDNTQWKFIFSQSVILLDRGNILSFTIPVLDTGAALKIVFVFSDEGEAFSQKTELTEDGAVKITLFKWHSESGIGFIENSEPLKILGAQKFYVKYQTNISTTKCRVFDLSVWLEV